MKNAIVNILEIKHIGHSMLLVQRPMKSHSSVCPSVRPSIRH